MGSVSFVCIVAITQTREIGSDAQQYLVYMVVASIYVDIISACILRNLRNISIPTL